MEKANQIQQITLVPAMLDKQLGASVHVGVSSVAVDADGKLFLSQDSPRADVELTDVDIVTKARELRDLVAQRLADSQATAVLASGDSKAALTQPKAKA